MSISPRRDDQIGPARAASRLASGIRARLTGLARRFARNERGVVFIYVAIAIVPLVAFVGISVDTTRGYLAKSRLSSAVDAAALAGGRVFSSSNRDADIQMYFDANFPPGYMGSTIEPLVITPNNNAKKLVVSAEATIPTSFMHIVGIDTIPLSATAEVIVESQNVEVAMVLDLSTSMVGQRTTDLKAAANQLVDIVVQDDQTLFYTKIAIVPYQQAVNIGGYDSAAVPLIRGAISPVKTITNVEKVNGSPRKIRVTTSTAHNLSNGDRIFIAGVNASSGANLDNRINNSMSGTYNSLNAPNFWTVAEVTATTFILKTGNGSAIDYDPSGTSNDWTGNYTSGGTVTCLKNRCPYLVFQRDSDNAWQFWIPNANCVTERFGADVTTDAAPSTTFVGMRYQPTGGSQGNDCLSSPIKPLSSSKSSLHTAINGLTAGGSTGGHIGVAWGWYLLSPNFGYLWPASSRPAAYGTAKLMKVMILMTDGEYNSVYRDGVIAQDSTSGSGGSEYKNNQNSNNGTNAYLQAQNLCAAMKAPGKGVIIYTVGLALVNKPEATTLVNTCATSPAHVYLPANGTEMQAAFQDIAMKISKLRLTQ